MKKYIYNKLHDFTLFEKELLSWNKDQIDNYLKQIDSNTLNFSLFLHNGDNFFITRHPRFIESPPHKHDYLELNYVIRGEITQNISGKNITLRKGDLLILNQYVTHSIETANHNDIMINFLIKPKFFENIFTYLENSNDINNFLFSAIYSKNHIGSYIYFQNPRDNFIENLMEKIILEFYEPSIANKMITQLSIYLIFLELINKSDQIEICSDENYETKLLISILKYIDENYKTANLDEISKRLKQQPYSLSKFIKEKMEISFIELIKEKRINKAIELIKNSNFSIEEIIYEVGYDSRTYFYKIFKEKTGKSPSDFRKNL